MDDAACVIGEGIQVRGNLSGSGDLVVQGRKEGHIALQAHVTIEQDGIVVAGIEAREMTIHGSMAGDTDATERIHLSSTATYEGNLAAPKIVLEEGARFCGSVKMDVPLPDDI